MSDTEKLIVAAETAMAEGRAVDLYVGDEFICTIHPDGTTQVKPPLRYDAEGYRRLMERARQVLGDA